jgi:hypothetical protein
MKLTIHYVTANYHFKPLLLYCSATSCIKIPHMRYHWNSKCPCKIPIWNWLCKQWKIFRHKFQDSTVPYRKNYSHNCNTIEEIGSPFNTKQQHILRDRWWKIRWKWCWTLNTLHRRSGFKNICPYFHSVLKTEIIPDNSIVQGSCSKMNGLILKRNYTQY